MAGKKMKLRFFFFSSAKAIREHGGKKAQPKQKPPNPQQKSTLWLTWQKSRDAGIPVCESGEDSGDKWTRDSPQTFAAD